MRNNRHSFGDFCLDPANRLLLRKGVRVDLPARALDVLILLVEANGDLVAKDRFMTDVWRGVPVTDEALTQTIRALRQALGDSATAPQFIETVPKHGYRFVAHVTTTLAHMESELVSDRTHARFWSGASAGAVGGVLAGTFVGSVYGFFGAAQSTFEGSAVSLALVMLLITAFSSGIAGFGISTGIAAARFVARGGGYWTAAGGALGGLIVGALGNLVGRDAFLLLLGRGIGPIAGAPEGFAFGAAIGIAVSNRFCLNARLLIGAGLMGMLVGIMLDLAGGKLMAGSISSLVGAFPDSALAPTLAGVITREGWLGMAASVGAAGMEGAVFTVSIVWALVRCRKIGPDRSADT